MKYYIIRNWIKLSELNLHVSKIPVILYKYLYYFNRSLFNIHSSLRILILNFNLFKAKCNNNLDIHFDVLHFK